MLKGDPLPRPYVVKPANEGSSVGVQIVTKSDNARPFDGIDWPYGETCWSSVTSPAAS